MTDHKPNKCYYKPNRTHPRYFTAKTAAEAFCYARSRSGITEQDFIDEVNKLCGWKDPGSEDWKRKLQDALDALEKVAEELLKQFGPGAIAKVLGKLWKMLPAPIRKSITDWAIGVGKKIGGLLSDAIDKVRRLPPPP